MKTQRMPRHGWTRISAVIGALTMMASAWAADPVVGQWIEDTQTPIMAVASQGNLAYLAAADAGLIILDISQPSQPARVGGCDLGGWWAEWLAVSGNFAYVCSGASRLFIIDVADPAQPRIVSSSAELGTPFCNGSVAVRGSNAYVTAGTNGLQVVDVSDPTHPVLVGSCRTSTNRCPTHVAVEGDYAYVADRTAGLQVIDVKDPARPVRVGGVATGPTRFGESAFESPAHAVAVNGDYAYVAAIDTGLVVIDVRDPTHPVCMGFGVSFAQNSAGVASSVAVNGNTVCVASLDNLLVFDVSDPVRLRVGQVNTGIWAVGVALSGPYALVAMQEYGLKIIDTSRVALSQRLGGYDNSWSETTSVARSGRHAYLASGSGRLDILDVSDSSRPVLVGGSGKTGRGDHVAADGDYVYLTGYDPKLQVFDASSASNPVPMGSYGTSGWATELAVRNGLAYLAGERWNETNYASGLEIIDVSDPTNLVSFGHIDTGGDIRQASLSGNHAYLGDRTPQMGTNWFLPVDIIDISAPSAPREVRRWDLTHSWSFTVSGRYAYVVGSDRCTADPACLKVFDVSDPARPLLVGQGGAQHSLGRLEASGNFLYGITRTQWGPPFGLVDVFGISDPTQPVWLNSYTTPGELVDLVADGNTAYVADRDAGLHIIRVYAPGVQPLRLIDPQVRAGQVQFTLTGQPGYDVEVSTSAELSDWIVTTNLLNVTGNLLFAEPAAPGTARFYRATQRP